MPEKTAVKAVIDSIRPKSGSAGDDVTLMGRGLATTTSVHVVDKNGLDKADNNPNVIDDSTVEFVVPSGLGSGKGYVYAKLASGSMTNRIDFVITG